jgi:cell division septation protein DedD
VADDPPATRLATPRAASRVATRSAAPVAAQAPAGNAPLSLAPDANNISQGSPARESFPPPPQRAAPPTRVATAPASGGGSYSVQVSSQKSEADAETAYRSIRSKYSSVLGSHPHQVRRADLGSRGVYYRALVGPFGSREEAVQVCSSLKQAGGDCVVQH